MPWKRRARKNVWQPRLTLEHTGFSGDVRWQWCLDFDRSSCGGPLLGDEGGRTPAEAWQGFRRFLERIGAHPVSREEARDGD